MPVTPFPTDGPADGLAMLADIERYYDAVPRPVATTEEVGPFTLFLAEEGVGWEFYARPRVGLDPDFVISGDDVRRVLDRQVELGRPRAIEWVHQTTPSLLPAVREVVASLESAGAKVELEECPLLVLPEDVAVEADDRVRVLAGDDPDLPLAEGAVHAGFEETDEVTPRDLGKRPQLIADGQLVIVAAYEDGRPVGGGSGAPRGRAAELMGIGVPPSARKRGLGSAITRGLVDVVRRGGVRTVLLSAGSDGAASIYRQVGFVDVGTACILGITDEQRS